MTRPAGYREVIGDVVTRRLWLASVASSLGDFVGAGALLVLAFEQSGGRAIGPAGLLAATGAGTIAIAIAGGTVLDRVDRRRGLVAAELAGGVALLLPLLLPSLWTAYVAAFVLGASRSASVSVRHGMLADAVPERLRAGLLALMGATDQASQVVGYATGATLAVTIGAQPALAIDLVTFLLGAVVLAGLPAPARTVGAAAPSLLDGWRVLATHPQLRLLSLLILGSAAASALPETLATAAVGTDSPWLSTVLAAGPAGAAIGYTIAGRLAAITRFSGQLAHLTLFAAMTLLGVLAEGPIGFTLVNLAVGVGASWIVGPQVAFVRLADPRHIAPVMAAIVALVTMVEGAWVVVAGAIADQAGVAAAYGVMGAVVSATALSGWLVHRLRGTDRARWDPTPGGRDVTDAASDAVVDTPDPPA